MTNIDQYQPCVCGSGKKFKFCKCGATDHVADLDKILRLMDGEQDLAALDRINSTLSKIPNASWLLALKAELNLAMQEFPTFVETANRFLKLKPDNPLALIFRSIATAIQEEPLEMQARYLLDGMAESRESLSSHALFAVHSLVSRLRDSESIGLIGMWGEMHEKATAQNPSYSILRDPSLHLACKSPNRIVDDSPNAPWAERLQEVTVLSSAFRFEQSEKKLQSILRDYPSQPGPLSHLLRSQVTLLERWPAVASAKKLAEHKDVSPEDRAYFRVLAWEFEQKPLNLNSIVQFGEIDSDETLIDALSKLDELRLDEVDESRAFMGAMIGDEVPAKRVYQAFQTTQSSSGPIKAFVGIVGVYGKQTDKPARVLFMAPDFPPNRPVIEKISGLLNITKPISDAPPYEQNYIDFLNRNRFVENDLAPWVTLDERGRQLVEEFLNLPQQVLEGQTPLEAAADERKRANLVALLLHLEGSMSLVVPASAIEEIYKRLELQQPAKTPVPAEDTQFSMSTYMDLLRLDYSGLSDALIVAITQLAVSKGASRLMYEMAHEIIRRGENSKGGLHVANSILLELDPDLNNKLTYVEKLEELSAAAKRPVGRLVLLKVDLLNTLGKNQQAQEFMLQAAKKYATDPELAAFFQQFQAMAQQQQMRGGDDLGMKMMTTAADRQAAKEQSGIILPGQAQPSGQGESKLWLPGT